MTSPIIWICDHIFSGEREVELIVHHEDDMWQLTCGKNDHGEDGAGIKQVHIEHVIKEDVLAKAMLNTPFGHLSERQEDGTWHTEAFNEDDD